MAAGQASDLHATVEFDVGWLRGKRKEEEESVDFTLICVSGDHQESPREKLSFVFNN